MKKIAVIIVNYNMPERANKLIEDLNNNSKYPHDIILVDNGSDLVKQSKYTTLRLKYNVQTTNGWLMGLHYADALEIKNKNKYLAYCFVITSANIVPNSKDILEEMANLLKNDESIVGIHPSLTKDSTTAWHFLKNTPGKSKQEARFIDNIFSCYRANWFNKIGRFDANQTYAWGIDLETSYFARKDNKKLILDNDIQISKISDIGYKMNRMNMSAKQRQFNASFQFTDIFSKKYGKNYRDLIYDRLSEKKDYKNTN